MKLTKKIIALLLALITVLTLPICTFAATTDAKTEEESDLGANDVATLYLVFTSANPKIPHLWIYIENETSETLQLGPYKIEGHGAVSLGAWKDRGNGAGIHINLERYWVKSETYGRAYYIKTGVTKNELKRMGNALDRHNYWNWTFNCAYFAVSMWNIASVKFIPFLISPRLELVVMLLYGAKRPDFKFKKLNDGSKCYKYITGGSLERVNSGALYTNTGV